MRDQLEELLEDERWLMAPADAEALEELGAELEGGLPAELRDFLSAANGVAAPYAVLYGTEPMESADPEDPWPDLYEANDDEDMDFEGIVVGEANGEPIMLVPKEAQPWRLVDAVSGDALIEASSPVDLLRELAD